jgi:hypothetical protein
MYSKGNSDDVGFEVLTAVSMTRLHGATTQKTAIFSDDVVLGCDVVLTPS